MATFTYLCECSDRSCKGRMTLGVGEYTRLSRLGNVVLVGHDNGAAVIEESEWGVVAVRAVRRVYGSPDRRRLSLGVGVRPW